MGLYKKHFFAFIPILLFLFQGFGIQPSSAQQPNTFQHDSLQARHYYTKAYDFFPDYLDSSIHYAKLAMPLAKKTKQWEQYVNCHNILFGCYYYWNDYKQTGIYGTRAMELANTYLDINHLARGDALNNLGSYYTLKADYTQAIQILKHALTLQENQLIPDRETIAHNYDNIGVSYRKQGDYREAIAYYQHALAIKASFLPTHHIEIADSYYSIAYAFQYTNETDTALHLYRKALSILPLYDLKQVSRDYISCYHNMARIFLEKKIPDSVKYYVRKAMLLHKLTNGKREYISYQLLGEMYKLLDNHPEALRHFQQSLALVKTTYKGRETHPNVATGYFHVAGACRLQKQYTEALSYYQQGLQTLVWDFTSNNIADNPELNTTGIKELLRILTAKAQTLYERHQTGQAPADLEIAHHTYIRATETLDRMRQTYQAQGSKLFWNEQGIPLYEQAIKIALELYAQTGKEHYREAAFQYMEKSKAYLLQEALNSGEALIRSGISDSLLICEKALQIDISYYEKKLFTAQAKKDTTKIQKYQSELFQTKREHESLIEHLAATYPKYHELKYLTLIPSLTEVQENLPNAETALLEYFWGKEKIYTFFISKSDIKTFTVRLDKIDPHLSELIALLHDRTTIKEKGYSPTEYDTFITHAHTTYQLLVKPALDDKKGLNHLIIIPDGPMGYLPFDILLTENRDIKGVDYATLPYLLKKYTINHGYSAGMFFNPKNRATTSRGLQTFAGFAPHYPNTTRLLADNSRYLPQPMYETRNTPGPLQATQPEVENIAHILGGHPYLTGEATEANFKKEAPRYKILHLAMHAFANNEAPMYSGFVFTQSKDTTEDGFLHAYELQNMHLNAEMAVLSACYTGYGKLARGEGIMSLARTFRYAGCPNIVTSLWQADDETTQQIMESFYKHLKSGKGKAEALNQAKLEALTTSKKTHPHFWASFVLIGDNKPMQFLHTRSYWQFILLTGLVLLFLIGLAIVRKRKNHNENSQKSHQRHPPNESFGSLG